MLNLINVLPATTVFNVPYVFCAYAKSLGNCAVCSIPLHTKRTDGCYLIFGQPALSVTFSSCSKSIVYAKNIDGVLHVFFWSNKLKVFNVVVSFYSVDVVYVATEMVDGKKRIGDKTMNKTNPISRISALIL